MTETEGTIIPAESYSPLSQGRALGIRQKVTDIAAREADSTKDHPSTNCSNGADCNCFWHLTEEQLRAQLQEVHNKLDLICTWLKPPPDADFTVPVECHAKLEAGPCDVTHAGTVSLQLGPVQGAASPIHFRGVEKSAFSCGFPTKTSRRAEEHHNDVCATGLADKAGSDIASSDFMDSFGTVGACSRKGPRFASSRNGTSVSLERKGTTTTDLEIAYRNRHAEEHKSLLEALVSSTAFDSFITCIVLLNTSLLGATVHHSAVNDSPPPAVYDHIEFMCVGIFTIELALRVAGQRRKLLADSLRHWAALDVCLVALSWLEVLNLVWFGHEAEPMDNASFARLFKVARMCRVFRALRMFRFLLYIRIMVIQIACSFNALGWFFVLLSFILYLFAVIITSGATYWLKPDDDAKAPLLHPQYEKVQEWYGGVHKTMYTLFMCITSGVDWGEAGTAIQATGQFYFIVFCTFMFIAIFSVLNIVTGVFVDSAIQQAEKDRVVRLQKEQRAKKELEHALTELFDKLDIDHDNFITEQEWMFACRQPQIREALTSLEIGGIVGEGEELFDLLDVDKDGVLRCSEFTDGLTMVRGTAKSVDLYKVHAEIRHVSEGINALLSRLPHDACDAPIRE